MRCVLDLRPQIEYTHSCDNAELPQKDLTWFAQQEDEGQSCAQAIKLDTLSPDKASPVGSGNDDDLDGFPAVGQEDGE